ncbi:MAG TPA: hypothetical protein VGK67_06225 [Myxococcales bacterium]|jgi:hypothetical protein
MEKLVYLVWAPDRIAKDRAAIRDLLLEECGPKLLGLGPKRLVVHVGDPESKMNNPMPFGPKDPPQISGSVDLWVDAVDQRGPFEKVLTEAGFKICGYQVEESIYRDYGGNPHSGPRTWADGERSPGVTVITLLERPKRLDYDEWIKRWHGVMSPVSEAIQPRTRYVRNRILRPVTEGALAIDGIVAEMWPSTRHCENPFLFFGAGLNPVKLAVNMAKILGAVTNFHDLMRVRTAPVSEYFLKTDFEKRA